MYVYQRVLWCELKRSELTMASIGSAPKLMPVLSGSKPTQDQLILVENQKRAFFCVISSKAFFASQCKAIPSLIALNNSHRWVFLITWQCTKKQSHLQQTCNQQSTDSRPRKTALARMLYPDFLVNLPIPSHFHGFCGSNIF